MRENKDFENTQPYHEPEQEKESATQPDDLTEEERTLDFNRRDLELLEKRLVEEGKTGKIT